MIKGRAGRPKRGTISLDEVIVRRLLEKGPATWGELKNSKLKGSMKNDSPMKNDSSLKKAIDRLREGMLITSEATIIDGKAITFYKLTRPPEAAHFFYRENIPLYRWIDETFTELSSSRSTMIRDKSSVKKKASSNEVQTVDEHIESQGNALAIALQGLSLEILNAIQASYELNEGSESKRRAYFETAWETYLSLIAMDISCLASSECGDTKKSIEIAKKKLNSIER